MSIFTTPIYDVLVADAVLVAMLKPYNGEPGIFTIDPVPGDAVYPLIVSCGEPSQIPQDTKNGEAVSAIRDVRCYAPAAGSSDVVEAMAWRVRFLFHRKPFVMVGYNVEVSDARGPVVANETDYYGRIVSVSVLARKL